MNSTLIIGIGTTGLSIIEEIQQLHYELCNTNKPGNNVAYLYLETDASRKPRKTPNGTTSIEQVVLGLGSNAVDISQLKANTKIDSTWIPEPSTVLQNEDGAGGNPSYGRLSFWGNQNYQNLANIIRDKYNSIGGDSQTQILIVGSVTGGTGSGLVIDVPYLVKNITNNSNVEAIILIPDKISLTTDRKPLHENAFSALAAIDFYSRPENTYKVVYPTGTTHEDKSPPFKYVQYLSQDFDNSKASIKTLGELVRIAGAIGLMRILDTNSDVFGFYNRLNQRRVDSFGAGKLLNTLTSGFQVVQYPKAQLEQLLSINLSKEILESLVDKDSYILPNNVKKPIKADELSLKMNAQQKFDDILERVFKNLDNIPTPAGNLQFSMKNDISTLIQNTHGKASNDKFIYDLFSINTQQNYFELLKNNEVTIKNNLIDELYGLFKFLLREYKNFYILNLLINDLKTHIDNTLAWYKREYGLTGISEDWNTVLTKNIGNLNKYKFDFQSLFLVPDYYSYSINHLLGLLKINSIIPVLEKIKVEFQGTSTPLINPQTNFQLPTKKILEKYISDIEFLINDDGSDNNYTLKRRTNEINVVLDNDSAGFRMVYTTGSKSEEMAQITSNYAKNVNNKLTLEKLLDTGDFWEFFLVSTDNLYETVISNSQRFIQSSNLIGNFDFATIKNLDNNVESLKLKELFNADAAKLKNNLPALIPLNNAKYKFADDPSMKTIVLTNDHRSYVNLFPNYNLNDTNSNIVDLPSLTNTIILYQEYCYLGENNDDQLFNPLLHISFMSDVKKHVAQLLLDQNGNLQNEGYMLKKVPYLNFEQLKNYLQ